MFGDEVYKQSTAGYTGRILRIDNTNYGADFLAQGSEIVRYKDDLRFRIEYEAKLKGSNRKLAIVA